MKRRRRNVLIRYAILAIVIAAIVVSVADLLIVLDRSL
jgi:hypothetical protein